VIRRIKEQLILKDLKMQNNRLRSHTQQMRCPGCGEIFQNSSDEDWIRCDNVNSGGVKTAVHTELLLYSFVICAVE
jgi:uncharacterized C2H2 Zn-finger protein